MNARDQGAVIKFVELVGSSDVSFSEAVRNVVVAARSQGHVIHTVDVTSSSATVGVDGGVESFVVSCKLGVVLEPPAGTRLGGGEVLPPDADPPERDGG